MDTAAKYLVDGLLDRSIDTYFGVPGGPISPLFDAVLRTKDVKLIESRQETAAIFEAIGYYKTTGKVPVVLVSAGPGIANCLNGLASAKALRIPLLVIAGEVSWERSDQILLQTGGPDGLDIEKTFEPHTEKVLRIKSPEQGNKEIFRFLDIRDGSAPSVIVFPINHSNAVMKDTVYPIARISRLHPGIISQISRMINEAERPLLVLGLGAKNCDLNMLWIISCLGIPFTTTPQGKGAGPESHDLSLRSAGMGASKWVRDYLAQAPDVVLVLGTDLDDCAIGTTEFANANTKIIHVDLDKKVFNRKYQTTIGVVEDIQVFCDTLMATFDASQNKFDLSIIQEIKKSSPYDVSDFHIDDSLPIAPHRAIYQLQQSSASNVRFVTDIGEHMLFALHYLEIDQQDLFSIDLGLGSMGSGIGQAIGMCIGDRNPTICIVGDGCMQMHGMEILTAIKYKLPIIFAVFNDARYNMVYHGFNFLFGRKENLGQTDFIDFAKFAESLGIPGFQINTPQELNYHFLEACFVSGGPVILDIRINKNIRIKGAGRNEALKHMGEFDG